MGALLASPGEGFFSGETVCDIDMWTSLVREATGYSPAPSVRPAGTASARDAGLNVKPSRLD